MPALLCGAAGAALFQFAGNATRGYVPTASAFWWWISQWIDPGAETQHGWIILALSGWLLWRNLQDENVDCRRPNAECGPDAEGRMASGECWPIADCRLPNSECQGTENGLQRDGRVGASDEVGGRDSAGCGEQGARGAQSAGGGDGAVTSNQRVEDNALHLERTSESLPAERGRSGAPGSRQRLQIRDSAFGIWHSAFAASPAFPALLAGLALHLVGFVAQQTRISLLGMLVFIWGVLRLGGGGRWGRAARFPLGFLVFAIPVNVLDSLGFWLRLWVVDAADAIARAGGFGLMRSGTQLFAPDGHYQYDVAAACSGVRSLVALAALSLLIGYLSFRSPWRRALMLLLCFPLTYVGNVVRIGAIILAAQAGGQRWGERAHDIMGFGVFAIVLGGVLLAARLLERVWPEREVASSPASAALGPGTPRTTTRAVGPAPEASGVCHTIYDKPSTRAVREDRVGCHTMYDKPASGGGAGEEEEHARVFVGGAWGRWAVAGVVVAVIAVQGAWLGRLAERAGGGAAGVNLTSDGRDPVTLPAFIGTEWAGRMTEVTAVERAILPADTGFSRRQYVSLQGVDHGVFFSVVLSGRDRTSIHRPEVCLVGQGWTLSSASEAKLGVVGREPLPVTLLRAELTEPRTGRRVRALVAYTFVSSDAIVATHAQRFLHDAWNRLRHGRADRWAYVLAMADAEDGEAAALARMQSVFAGVAPALLATK